MLIQLFILRINIGSADHQLLTYLIIQTLIMITRVSQYLKHQSPIFNKLSYLNLAHLQSCAYHKLLTSQTCCSHNNHASLACHDPSACNFCLEISHPKSTVLNLSAPTRAQGMFRMLSHRVVHGYSIIGDKSKSRNQKSQIGRNVRKQHKIKDQKMMDYQFHFHIDKYSNFLDYITSKILNKSSQLNKLIVQKNKVIKSTESDSLKNKQQSNAKTKSEQSTNSPGAEEIKSGALKNMSHRIRNTDNISQYEHKKDGEQSFQIFYTVCIKAKLEGIKLYNVDGYQQMVKFYQSITEKSTVFKQGLTEMVNKLVKNIQKQNKQIQMKNQKILADQRAQTKQDNSSQQSNTDDMEKKTNVEQKQQRPFKLNLNKYKLISIANLSTLIANLEYVPKQHHELILGVMISRLSQISPVVISIFMMDSILYKRQLSFSFLQQLTAYNDQQFYQGCFRYAELLFLNHNYQESNFTTVFSLLANGKKVYHFDHLIHFQSVLNYCKILTLEMELCQKTSSRMFFYNYHKLVLNLQRYLIQRRFFFFGVIRIYNLFAKVTHMGLQFLKQLPTYKDIVVTDDDIEETKKFLLNFTQNFKSDYIYSVDQKSINEVTQPIVNLAKNLALQTISKEPEFLLQVTQLFSSHLDYNAQFTKKFDKILVSLYKKYGESNFVSQHWLKNDEKDQVFSKMTKLIHFTYTNYNYIEINQIQPILMSLYDQFMQIPNACDLGLTRWKFLFEFANLIRSLEQSSSQKFRQAKPIPGTQNKVNYQSKVLNLYKKFGEPYFKQNQENLQESVTIRRPNLHQEYVLRFANIIKPSYFINNPERAEQISNFINKSFIYSVKCVLKIGIFQILNLLERLPNIDPEIYAYLFSNLSSFILYIQRSKKFYLTRGKMFRHDTSYLNILNKVTQNWKQLRKIKNKDRLNMIKLLSLVFWKRLTNRQVAQLLIIIGSPTLLGDKLRLRVQRRNNFTPQDISNLDYEALMSFRLQNKSLMQSLKKVAPNLTKQNEQLNVSLNNKQIPQKINQLFQSNEYYEQALQTQQFTNQHLIPPPKTNDPKVKMIYACLKIVNKIRQSKDFSIDGCLNIFQKQKSQKNWKQADIKNQTQTQFEQTKPKRHIPKNMRKSVDLSQQIRYIQNENLVPLHDTNEFRLDNIVVKGHYEMIQGWSTFDESQNLIEIEDYSNFGDADDNPYEKVLLAVNGNTGLIKQLVKKESFNPNVLEFIYKYSLQPVIRGSLIEVVSPKDQSEQLFIFCSNNSNYKVHMIYCYVLSQVGYRVCQVTEKNTKEQISKLFETIFDSKIKIKDKVEATELEAPLAKPKIIEFESSE